MSGLTSLPPDQRAVLQLILKQGRGYDDLAGLLRIDASAVRDRALAGLDALAPDAARGLTPERRAEVGDYLLGQQDDATREATSERLAGSGAARDWAAVLREQLAPVASGPLPEVPGAGAANGSSNGAATRSANGATRERKNGTPPAPSAEPAPAGGASATTAAQPAASASPPPPSVPRPGPPVTTAPPPRRGSRLGGILLIAGIAVVIAVVVILLVNRGGDDDNPTAAAPPSTQTTPAATSTTAATGTTTAPRILGQANINAPAGGQARGLGYVVPTSTGSRRETLALQVEKMPANTNDAFAVWLRGAAGVHLLGYNQRPITKAGGTLAVTAALPANVKRYDEVLVTRESTNPTANPTRPGPIVASGPLRFR